jgi:hypothetical protein
MVKSKHTLLNVPLKEIMKDKKSLAKIYCLALNVKYINHKKLKFTYNGPSKTSWPSYISIKYYIRNKNKSGIYRNSVDIGYSDISGIEVSITDNNIHSPFNSLNIGLFIKRKGWVKEDILKRISNNYERDILVIQHKLLTIKNKSFYRL